MDIVSIAVGAAGVGGTYFAYLAATKGLPAAWAWLKAKWSAGKTQLAKLESDLSSRISALEADVAKLKAAGPATPPQA